MAKKVEAAEAAASAENPIDPTTVPVEEASAEPAPGEWSYEDRAAGEALMRDLVEFKKRHPGVNVADLLESVGLKTGSISRA